MKGAMVALLALTTLAATTRSRAATELPEVLAVRLTTIDFRPAIRLLVSDDMPAGRVTRDEGEVVIRLPGVAAEDLTAPSELGPPLTEIRVVREESATEVRVTVAPEVPFEAAFEVGLLTVVFGATPDPAARGPVTPELYGLLFPSAASERLEDEGAEEDEDFGDHREGLYVGRVQLLPYLTVSYVDADVLAFNRPEPIRARYLEVAPGITANSAVFTGRLAVEYEPRFRFFSDIPEINETAHFAGVRLDFPLGSRTLLALGHRYTRATLETTVVDPGREYFFGLSRYTFNNTTASARIDVGPSFVLELDAGWRRSSFDRTELTGFFGYDSRAFRAGLGYDLRSDLRVTVSYAYDHVPRPSDRPVAESTAHNVLGTITGQISSLTSGTVTVGWRTQTNPLGSGEGEHFRGVTLGGALSRQLGHSSNLGLTFTRTPSPSGYLGNPYYVNNSLTANLELPLPLQFWIRGTVGFLRNSYPTIDPSIGEPRRDDIWAWTIGVGRHLGWRTWIRADYRREDRDSNVPAFDITTDGFVVQFGIGRTGPGASR